MAPEGSNDDVAGGHGAGAGAEGEEGASGEDLRACLFQLLQVCSDRQSPYAISLDFELIIMHKSDSS